MVAGLLCDLDHEDAAEFSFLLATPVIFAAALLETRYLVAPGAHVVLLQAIVGGVVAAVAAYLSVAFLMRYFKSNDLRPFGWYCLIVGVVCFILSKRGLLIVKPLALLLALAFFVLGVLYGLGTINFFTKSGTEHSPPHHAFGVVLGACAALPDLVPLPEQYSSMITRARSAGGLNATDSARARITVISSRRNRSRRGAGRSC